MKAKNAVLIAVVIAAAAGGWAFWERGAGGPEATAAVATSDQARNGASQRSADGAAGTLRPASVRLNPPLPAKPLTLSGELAAARSYKALYDRLANNPEGQTAEGQYVLYRILRACANVTDRRGRLQVPRVPTEEQKQAFYAGLSDRDPNRAKRIAAFENIAEDRCVGLTGIVTTEAELAAKLSSAVAAGSPAARATQVEQEMWAERRGSQERGGPTLSDAQLDALRASLASKDPEAILAAGRVLSNSFRDITLRIGPEQLNAEGRALMNAWQLAACDYGYPCGDSNFRVLNACAYQGHCEAGNLPDFLSYYNASPHDSVMQEQYRQTIRRAIETGDWSALTFARGPTNPITTRFFSPPPGFGPTPR